jgi:hypothetical protein
MIDDPNKTDLLIAMLKESLPIQTKITPYLARLAMLTRRRAADRAVRGRYHEEESRKLHEYPYAAFICRRGSFACESLTGDLAGSAGCQRANVAMLERKRERPFLTQHRELLRS